MGAAEPDGVEKVTASELAGAEVEQTPTGECGMQCFMDGRH